MKITKCKGEGQGSCKRCTDNGRWNRTWMCFLYEIEGLDGCYCNDCVDEIMRNMSEYEYHELVNALDTGIACGLQTVGEAVLNIELHSTSIFSSYDEIQSKLNQLHEERDKLFSHTNFTNESSCEDVLGWINWKEVD